MAPKGPPGRPWPPGVSGNPKGRPPLPAELRELARSHAPEAIAGLLAIAKDESAQPSARVRAWEALLARGYGQPTQPLEHAGADGGALTVVIHKEQAP